MIEDAYETYVRPVVPKTSRLVDYNGVTVRTDDVCIIDELLRFYDEPWYNSDVPDYEETQADAVRSFVETGDEVVEVGGGRGVTAVIAARQVGESGKVVCFEGSERLLPQIEEAIQLNSVEERVDVRHAVVGTAVRLRGESGSAEAVAPSRLPSCDVLELNCDGSETQILKKMEIKPQTIIVETHGAYGAPTEDTIDVLDSLDYEIVRNVPVIKEKDIRNVVATLS